MNRPRSKDRHLPRCVYYKHGAYYLVKAGKWHPLGTNLKEALSRYADLFAAPKGGMPELIGNALAVILPTVSASTQQQYRVAGRKLAKAFVEFGPLDVKPRHIAALMDSMAATPNMANRCLSVLRQVFHYALNRQIVDANPAVGLKRHKESKRTRLPTQAEFDAVYAQAGERLQVIMDLLRFAGQRTVDTLRTRESDIGEDGIRYRQQKTGSYLTVKWTPGLRKTVARARALQGQVRSMYLLPSRSPGKPPDYRSVRYQWDMACKAAGVEDLHLHDLRAMAATRARKEGKDARKLMGHSSDQQTNDYLRDKEPELVEGPEF